MLCEYKNMLGEVRKGIHSVRLFDIAVIDVLLTFLSAYVICRIFPELNFTLVVISLFGTGIILHRLFCVSTKIDTLIFN